MLKEQLYPDGTEIVVLSGDYKGEYGVVIKYESVFDRYFVQLPNFSVSKHFAFQEEELAALEPEEEQEEELETPGFGMTEDEFVQHLEFLLGRTLAKVPTASASDAFFGYQQFEGMTPDDVMLTLLGKLEDGIAHLAQTHILVSRIALAYRKTVQEISDAN